MFEAIKSGGWIMIPIIICGIIAVFIIIERIFYYCTIKKRDEKLMIEIRSNLENRDFHSAESNCDLAATPCSQVIKFAIQNRNFDEEHLRELVQLKLDESVTKLEKYLTTLGIIASISTLLGLLGTVTGNISAFGVLSGGASMGDPALLASSIAQALVTTVAGLIVAIPSIIFHNYFNNTVNHQIKATEANVTYVIYKLIGKGY